jgi:hydroxymethylpyrimidine/phosphomethylpyrimidine kinase
MQKEFVLSIAGFDPSGGAGLLADAKTFEQMGVQGIAVNTANTIQNEDSIEYVDWLDDDVIFDQMEALKDYPIKAVKMGLVGNGKLFGEILEKVNKLWPDAFIVWDPILESTSGFIFHESRSSDYWKRNVDKIHLITPNVYEMQALSGIEDEIKAAKVWSKKCSILLTGGHSKTSIGKDLLVRGGESVEIVGNGKKLHEKHGSGCVLSSAIASELAKGNELEDACRLGKEYIEKFLGSNDSLLGHHV